MEKIGDPKISATIITRNEETNIEDCLQALLWADEIVVLDSVSTDRTVELARRYTDNVFVETWAGQGAHKNRAAELATGPWIFSVDADERVTPELAMEIREVVKTARLPAYAVRRKNMYRKQWIRHGGWWPDWVNRLFLKERARFNDEIIHDSLVVDGPLGKLHEPLIHHSFANAGAFLERAYRYSMHQADRMYREGRRASFWTAFSHGSFEFIHTYLVRRGFLDGTAGFLIAVSNAAGAFYKYMILTEKCAVEDGKREAGL